MTWHKQKARKKKYPKRKKFCNKDINIPHTSGNEPQDYNTEDERFYATKVVTKVNRKIKMIIL